MRWRFLLLFLVVASVFAQESYRPDGGRGGISGSSVTNFFFSSQLWTNDGVVLKGTTTGVSPNHALRWGAVANAEDWLTTNVARWSVAFGSNNMNGGSFSTISGGYTNYIFSNAVASVIGGGATNKIEPGVQWGVIGGGNRNIIRADSLWGTISGGFDNVITNGADWATIGGGDRHRVATDYSVVAGGHGNQISGSGGYSFIGSGDSHSLTRDYAFIGGGQQNACQGDWAFVGGGFQNNVRGATSHYSTIGGGQANLIGVAPSSPTTHAFIGGGNANQINQGATAATISGGAGNLIAANNLYAVIAGGFDNGIGETLDSAGQYSVIGGGLRNLIYDSGTNAVIGGGRTNLIATGGHHSVIDGGLNNFLTNQFSVIGGGQANTNYGAHAVVGGGLKNFVDTSGDFGVIPSGASNRVNAANAWVLGTRGTNTLSFSIDIAPNGDTTKTTFTASNVLYRAPVYYQLQTLTYSGTNVTVDWSLGDAWSLVLTNNTKLWFTNSLGTAGSTKHQRGTIDLVQDGNGSRLLFWDATNFKTNAPVVLSTAANAVDKMVVYTDHLGTNFQVILHKTFQ